MRQKPVTNLGIIPLKLESSAEKYIMYRKVAALQLIRITCRYLTKNQSLISESFFIFELYCLPIGISTLPISTSCGVKAVTLFIETIKDL
jgi:hypothetical protein